MGSSTKKHKRDKDKDSKKKKYRSRTRSRSPLSSNEREKERRHHKKHKDRKRDRSPDVQEVPVDSHLHRSRSTEVKEKERRRSTPPRVARVTPEPPAAASESLSVEETNRLRAKLGLKPLQLEEKTGDDGKIKDDLGEFYHKPASNIADQKKAEKIKARLAERKEKRQLEERLLKGTLADVGSDEDEDAVAWVKRNREITQQKEVAAKRAAMLDEMDEVFGVSALVDEEAQVERGGRYTANNLRGLKVAHDTDAIKEGRDVVLTLADKEVLAEDGEDVLVNVNMVDDERYKKNVEMKRKSKLGYQAYEDADDLEAAAMGIGKTVLSKYDEEIEGDKNKFNSGFVIGDEDALELKKFKQEMIREKLATKRLESLRMPEMQLASDYYSEQELQAKFKKPKRKGKIRKKAKTEPIDVDEYDHSSAPLVTDDTDVNIEYKSQPVEDDEEQDTELEIALARARRMRLAEEQQKIPKLEEILEKVKNEPPSSEDASGHMVLDSTAEFCRTLGDIPTYGQAGNRDEDVDALMDFEVEEPQLDEPNSAGGAWNSVDVKADVAPQVFVGGTAILDVEPSLGAGVGGALRLALSKGYLECGSEGSQPARAPRHAHLLRAQHYSIDDKAHNEDDKFSRRGDHQRYAGPLTDFREKDNFRPDVKLEYIDDEGRPLCPKEAFRYLSHKFHGKGPGKNKQEKRIKKNVQEGLMKKMSSTDTPLGTLAMLQGKQKETQSPYILLSGPKRDPTRPN